MDGVEGHQWANARPSLSCGVMVGFRVNNLVD